MVFVLEMALSHWLICLRSRAASRSSQMLIPCSCVYSGSKGAQVQLSLLECLQKLLPSLHSQADQLLMLTCIILAFKKYFPFRHVGFVFFPVQKLMVMETPALESQTNPQKLHQTSRNVIWAFEFNSKFGKRKLTMKKKKKKKKKK